MSDCSGDVLRDELCRRQVPRTLLGQTFRLTDTIIDLYYADERTGRDASALPGCFIDWLESDDPGTRQIFRDCKHWLAHLRLIVDSCLQGAGRSWRELARKEIWPQLHNSMAVFGVTGGSGGHRTAIRQFRTPSLPRVIVCTDTLKEGVDLHLFCDRVMHYGVAWTSGDLEQRVGRVDRFFSMIERRLNLEGAPPAMELQIAYPHIAASLESGQVNRVIERQRQAEKLMDSPLACGSSENKELIVGVGAPREEKDILGPYPPTIASGKGREIVAVSEKEARAGFDHYVRWYSRLIKELGKYDWKVSPEDDVPVRDATLCRKACRHDIKWVFDRALGRYVLTLSNLPGGKTACSAVVIENGYPDDGDRSSLLCAFLFPSRMKGKTLFLSPTL